MIDNPVFVVGAPRSGTTLLQLILAAHSNLYSLPETHYFTYISPKLKKLHSNDNLPNCFLKYLEEKPQLFFSNCEKSNILEKLNVDHSDKRILESLVAEYKVKHGLSGKRWVEKTPRHVNHLVQIFKLWPNSKVINIIRDPRDVISSFHSLRRFSSKYKNYIDVFLRIEKYKRCIKSRFKNNSTILDVKYENLIADPEKQVIRIMEFIGEKFEPDQLLNFSISYETSTLGEEKHKLLCNSREIVDRRSVWETRLDDDEVYWIEKLCTEEFNLLNYKLSKPKISFLSFITIFSYFAIFSLKKHVLRLEKMLKINSIRIKWFNRNKSYG